VNLQLGLAAVQTEVQVRADATGIDSNVEQVRWSLAPRKSINSLMIPTICYRNYRSSRRAGREILPRRWSWRTRRTDKCLSTRAALFSPLAPTEANIARKLQMPSLASDGFMTGMR
jgi:hypothetical protein